MPTAHSHPNYPAPPPHPIPPSPASSSTFRDFKINFAAGCVGLSTAFAVMHPVDTLKTRMQAVSTSSSITFKTLFTRDVMRTLSRGFVASVVGAGPQGGTRLSTYELTKSYLLRPPSSSRSSHTPSHPLQHSLTPIPASAISAIVGDFASSIVKVPREVITARLQTGHYASTSSSSKPPGAMYAINRILHEEGPIGLFRGFWSTMARDCPFMVILFVTYESFKSNYQSQLDNIPSSPSDSIPTHTSTLYGGISGGLAGFFTTPFDVIKTRIMTHKTTSPTLSSQTPPPAAATVSSSSSSSSTAAARQIKPQTIPVQPSLSMRSIAYQIYLEQLQKHTPSKSVSSTSASSSTSPASASSSATTTTKTTSKTTSTLSKAKPKSSTVSKRVSPLFSIPLPRFFPSIALFSSSSNSSLERNMALQRKVYTETVKAFWRGAVPRSCWWFCVCSIFFPCYEGVKDGLRSF